MRVDLDLVRALIIEAARELPTGDGYADALYDSIVDIVGHTRPYYKLFYLIAHKMNPALVVELGSWRAIAAAHFAAGGAEVITVDCHDIHDDPTAKLMSQEVADHYPNITFLNGWSWDRWVVDRIASYGRPIDVLFVDATHRYDAVKKELALYTPILADEALVIYDDVIWQRKFTKDMRDMWGEITHEKFLDYSMHNKIPMGFVRWKVDGND